MWPSVAFRLTGLRRSDKADLLEVAAANFEAVPAELEVESTLIAADPDVIHGVMSINEFIELLRLWRNHEAAPLREMLLAPPADIGQLDWSPDLPEDMIWGPLLERLPPSASLYRVHRLTGGGGQPSPELKSMLQEQTTRLRLAPIGWSQQYLGLVWDGNMNYVTVHLPVAVRFEASYERQEGVVRLDVFFRQPYRIDQFWSRLSTGAWKISVPRHPFKPVDADRQGWAAGRLQLSEQFDAPINAWIGTTATPNRFDWEVTLGRTETIATPSSRAIATDPRLQLIDDLRTLTGAINRAEVRSFLDEALRCLEVGAFRAAAIMAWAGAIAVLQDGADQHGLKIIEEAAKSVNRKAHDLRNRNDLQYFTDDLLLNSFEKAGLINKTELGLLLQQLKRRNAYAHPSGVEPSVEEVRAIIAELVRIVFSRFSANEPS
jgi:hypothetical protein